MWQSRIITAAACVALLAACSSSTNAPSGNTPSASNDAGASTSRADSGAGSNGTPSGGGDAGGPTSGFDASTPIDGAVPTSNPTLRLVFPANFTGTVRQIDVVANPTLPLAGPPAAILYQSVTAPTVAAGQTLDVDADATGVTGSDYVLAVVYMVGGGQFSPTNGVDYVAQTASPVALDGTKMDLGTMNLVLAGTDGGP